MANTWKAKLPKGLPDSGRIQFIFAVQTSSGYRVEYTGTCDEKKGLDIYNALIQAAEATKER